MNLPFSQHRYFLSAAFSFAAGAAFAQSADVQASGYAPGWSLSISSDVVTFSPGLHLQEPPPKLSGPVAAPRVNGTTRIYEARMRDGLLTATISKQPCTDAVSAIVHPDTAQVRYGANLYLGCGGDPLGLLQGQAWVVEDIAARGVLDRSRITLQFGPGTLLRGRASCNPYEGSYAFAEGTLRLRAVANPSVLQTTPALSPGATAAPAICPPALRRQDAAFFEVLGAITRWDFTADGALTLGTVDGRRIVARRP